MTDDFVFVEATYENVSARCPSCGLQNTFNRVTDLGTTRPIDSYGVTCCNPACGKEFSIGGDLINPAHELLLYECKGFLDRKEYMQCVLGIARAYEVFFAHYLHVQLIFRPVHLDRAAALEDFNALHAKLNDKLKKFTFGPLRCLFLKMNIAGCAPSALADCAALIAAIPDSVRTVQPVSSEDLQTLPAGRLREMCTQLHESKIGDLRNSVVHKSAYRPTYQETVEAYEQAHGILVGLTQVLGLQGTAESYINGH